MSIKVILLNTNWNESFITNFSSVCFNTFEAQKWNRRGCIHWHLHFAKLNIVIKVGYLRTNRKELLLQKRFFARQYTAGTLSSTLIWQWFIYILKRYIAVGEANGKSSTFTLENNRLHTDCVTWTPWGVIRLPTDVLRGSSGVPAPTNTVNRTSSFRTPPLLYNQSIVRFTWLFFGSLKKIFSENPCVFFKSVG